MVYIRTASGAEYDLVFRMVEELLAELSDELAEYVHVDYSKLINDWLRHQERITVFLAETEGRTVGLLTLTESIAVYAGGCYGVIDELYVHPEFRNAGVGSMLVETALQTARIKGWGRVDVTAPQGDQWQATRSFYENKGFSFTGPKLKYSLY